MLFCTILISSRDQMEPLRVPLKKAQSSLWGPGKFPMLQICAPLLCSSVTHWWAPFIIYSAVRLRH